MKKKITSNSRRRTIKNITLAGTSLALLPYSSSSEIFNEKKLGVALVGLGNYATRQIAPALESTKFCKLQAIVTGTPRKAAKWKAQYNIPDEQIYNYENSCN